jgi:streptogramin lyase
MQVLGLPHLATNTHSGLEHGGRTRSSGSPHQGVAMRRLFAKMLTLAVVCGAVGTASAQQFTTKVVATGLKRPTGISVSLSGKVYFTELPTPGVNGPNGGTNKVSVLTPGNGKIKVLATGEPEPTNLATTFCGDVYWTCKSAGVVVTLDGGKGDPKLVVKDLDKPTGMAAYPFGGVQYYTEVPTPGVSGAKGGTNKVYAFLEGIDREVLIDEGDPQPSDVAVDLAGVVYWTCTSAGVIVKFSGGKEEVIAKDLKNPTGLATDYLGNLYFTEVPTPGVSGAKGGMNKVSKLRISTGEITLINAGDPDPIDVTAHPDGTVYWTCRSAGVIVEATPKRRQGPVSK